MSGLVSLALCLLLLGGPALGDAARTADAVDPARLAATIERFAGLTTRVTGSPGAARAADWIEEAFAQAGLRDIRRQPFRVPVPADGEAGLTVGGTRFRLRALWPNYVRLSAVPTGGLDAPLVYVGDGSLDDLRGLDLDGAIALVDFNCGQRWLDLATLGARAVIFVAPPGNIERGEAQRKFLKVPVDVPRFYLSRLGALRLDVLPGARSRVLSRQATLSAQAHWQNAVGRNVMGVLPGRDAERSRECLVVTAYYDSSSVVPSLAPGAEQAGGLACLLETVRLLAADPPARSVLFVALDGHHLGLAGARSLAWLLRRDYIRERWPEARELMRRDDERYLAELDELLTRPEKRLTHERLATWREELTEQRDWHRADADYAASFHERYQFVMQVALDLSSGSDQVGLFHCGHFYRDVALTRFLSPIGKAFPKYAEEAGQAGSIVDCINPQQDVLWDSWVPDQFATDAEPLVQAARPAVSLFTVRDARPAVDTPDDRPRRVDVDRLTRQIRGVVGALRAALDDPGLVSDGLRRIKRLPYRYQPIMGPVYEFERRRTFLPNTPVPGALVALRDPANAMLGVKPDIMVMANQRGDYRLVGYDDLDLTQKLDAYSVEPGTGRILYAPDLGPEGELKYPRGSRGRQGLRRPTIVFPCTSIDLFDLIDQRYFETLEQLQVYDARTDSEPRSYGYDLPISSAPVNAAGTVSASYVEPVATVHAPRGVPVKITMSMGLLGLRFILTNATAQNPAGAGFDPAATPRITRTPYQAAEDMWVINQSRMVEQQRFGIQNRRLEDLHARARERLDRAAEALGTRDWGTHLAAAREGWAFEARAYPDVQGTEADVVKGVLFYLALLLPFAFFVERLLFASPRIREQILRTLGIFLLVYFCLRYVHPAFRLLDTPWIILLGFVIMTLALLVIAVVARRFNEELDALKQAAGGTHSADVSRSGTLGAAFSLGISNMRRRPLRSAMTAITLILLSFTVLSFTSVGTTLRSNARLTDNAATYPGILIRDPVWGPLEAPTARILEAQFSGVGTTAPRAWLTSAALDKQMKLAARNGTAAWATETGRPEPPASAAEELLLGAVLGLTADEPRVSGLGGQLVAGRWFADDDGNVCVVPAAVAERLDVGPGSTAARAGLGLGAIEVFGTRFEVIGVLADDALTATVDLDGEALTPVDFSELEPDKLQMVKELATQKLKLGRAPTAPIDRYTHFAPGVQIVLPYERLMSLGGTLRSVAVRFGDPDAVTPAAQELMERFELSAYAARDRQVLLYSTLNMTSVSGLQTVLIPLIIAALIVLNTMLGAVAERLREIGIFSSIGLAPAHIGMLFLAESAVLANVGIVVGYLLGQTLAKVMYWATQAGHLHQLAGLSLNYSSTAAVGVALIIMATVLLSTLYPARKAARMATPDMERRWRLPQPDGHVMRLPLPFMLTGRDGVACNTFLKEYFDAFVDFPGGDFYTDGTVYERTPAGLRLALTVWLAPYDLGVSQRVELLTVADAFDPNVYAVEIVMERLSGDDTSWRRTNWLFVSILRQQFLIWRTVPPPAKLAYAERGEAHLAGD